MKRFSIEHFHLLSHISIIFWALPLLKRLFIQCTFCCPSRCTFPKNSISLSKRIKSNFWLHSTKPSPKKMNDWVTRQPLHLWILFTFSFISSSVHIVFVLGKKLHFSLLPFKILSSQFTRKYWFPVSYDTTIMVREC